MITATVLLAVAMAQDPPPLAWRVVTPFDAIDVANLEEWWQEHVAELGATATFERAVVLGMGELLPDTLLLGFERGTLLEADRDGALGSPVVTIAFESWAPARAMGGQADAPEFDTWQALLDPMLRGRVHLRAVTRESSEGLVLGELARRLDLVAEEELPRLVIASYEAATIHAASTSLRALLESLRPGAITIVPVRVAARARRDGARVVFESPREGFFALELAAAATAGTSEAHRRWFAERFEPSVAPKLARALELEPAGALPPDASDWLRHVAPRREAVDREAAGALRVRLARLYEGVPPRGALPDPEAWLDRLDTLLLTAVVVAALLFWRHERRRRVV